MRCRIMQEKLVNAKNVHYHLTHNHFAVVVENNLWAVLDFAWICYIVMENR